MPAEHRKSAWSLVVLLAATLQAQSVPGVFPKAAHAPTLPFFDWNVCPGEGCQYGQWRARKAVTVYDTWKPGRTKIAQLAKGDTVLGVTGGVITYQPGVIHMDRDLPEQHLKAGDTILTYAYRGEGESAAWLQGKFYSDFDISFASPGCGGAHCAATYVDPGRKVWWAQVKLSSGRLGWVNMNDADFDGSCAAR